MSWAFSWGTIHADAHACYFQVDLERSDFDFLSFLSFALEVAVGADAAATSS
eukprot:m.10750 g.10750  ORF g.10750 m.10750 type:complete len:52 (+) comp5614_c0_seq1:354-509(+)